MIKAKTFEYTEAGTLYRATVNYGRDETFAKRNNQEPYFSVTVDVYAHIGFRPGGKWREDSFGCQHELAIKLMPELEPYIKWHLATGSGPMHYVPNALYWWAKVAGISPLPARSWDPADLSETLRNHVCLGTIEGDEDNPLFEPIEPYAVHVAYRKVFQWLEEREQKLSAAFIADMASMGV